MIIPEARLPIDEHVLDSIAPSLEEELREHGGLWRVVVTTGRAP